MIAPPDTSPLSLIPPEVLKEIYTDGAKNILQEVAKIGVDAVKTVRLCLFPLQFAGLMQDRLCRYFQRALSKVPDEDRIAPAESLALSITEKLRHQEEGSVITEMYINLLSRAADRKQVGQAHPAFVYLISQLAPDEATMIEQMACLPGPAFLRRYKQKELLLKPEREVVINLSKAFAQGKEALLSRFLRPEELAQPDLAFTYLEHLVSLGLVSYSGADQGDVPWRELLPPGYEAYDIGLNGFGRLFHRACLSETTREQRKSEVVKPPSTVESA